MAQIIKLHRDKRTAGQHALRIAERLRASNPNIRVTYRREGKQA